MEAFCKSAWLGLNSYQESDSPRFFGRNEESDRLVEAISENGLCTVFGPSGAGKTSLLLAGVFPRLRRSDFFPVYLRFDHEKGAARYVRQVVDALDGAVHKAGFAIRETAPSVLPAADETLWEWFHRHLFLDDCLNPIRPVLMIDQFEEIFTKGLERRGVEEVQAFFTELTDLCTNNIPQTVVRTVEDGRGKLEFDHENCNWRLVVSLREDFLPRLEEVSHDHPVFRKMRQSVSSLTRDQALQAVRGPGGELVDETVATAIVDAVGRSASGHSGRVEPALLSLFCSRLDIARQQKGLGRITPELLAASGKDILAGFYAETMGQVSERTAEQIEDHLLTAGGYRDSWAEEDAKHAGVLQSEIDTLVNARLLHVDHRGGVCWLEFSHDILTSVARASRDGRRQRKETEVLQAKLRRQRAHTRRVTGLLVALVALLAVSTVAVWHLFYREYAPCYLRTVKVFGRIQGVGDPLSESDKRHVSVYFKLRHHGRYSFHPHAGFGRWFEKSPVYRMEAFDGRGQPTTQHGMGTYLWDGEEVSDRGAGALCKPISDKLILTNDRVRFLAPNEIAKSTAWDDDLSGDVVVCTRADRNISTVGNFSRERESVEVRVVPSDELQKVCAWEFDYGDDGRLLHEFGIDQAGNRIWDCTYAPCLNANQWRQKAVVHYVDAWGFPMRQGAGRAEYVEIRYDEQTGYERCYIYYDAGGGMAKGRDGASKQELNWDRRGLCTNLSNYVWIGRMFANVGRETRMYDAEDNEVDLRYYGRDGNPVLGKYNVHRMCRRYERLPMGGRRVTEWYLGVDDRPVLIKDGYARCRCEFDEFGSMTTCRFEGIDGSPTLISDGSSGWAMQCDMHGWEIRKVWLGVDGMATLTKDGYAERRYDYDVYGNKIACRFYGPTGELICLKDGFAGWRAEYDIRGLEVCKTWFDESGRMVLTEEGYAQCLRMYNAAGKVVACRFNDTNGHPINIRDGYAECRYWYDALGNRIACRFYGIDGEQVLTVDGFAGWTAEYYSRGLVARTVWHDMGGRPTLTKEGCAECRYEYDARGNKTMTRYYGVDGKPTVAKVGYAGCCCEYDARGNMIECRFYGADGKPVLKEGLCAVCRWKYDEHNEVVGKTFFDEKMEPVRIVSIAFASEIIVGSHAAAIGVKEGDVFCEFGTYRLRDDGDFSAVKSSIREFAQKEKRLVVARKFGDGNRILAFDLPAGKMGIRICDRQVTDREFEKIQKAYCEYLDKGK